MTLCEERPSHRIEHMFEDVASEENGPGDRLGRFSAAVQAELSTLGHQALDDAALVAALTRLEVAKAACAAAQARLTERLVASRADTATRLRAEARACAHAGDFDGWVLARDRARTLELDPEVTGRGHGRRRPAPQRKDTGARSRKSQRLMLSRTGVAAEVALARRESPTRGSRLANASVALVRHLPHTLAALAAGILNERRAELVVRATSHLGPEVRAQVDAEVIGAHVNLVDPASGLGGWGDRELERRVRACADRLDAEAAVERCRLAESERRVTIRPVPDTMALVTALLPVAQAVAVHAALTRAAGSAKAAGDPRGKGQLMADTLVERLTGQATASDVPVEVQLVMTDRALLAGAATPAHVPGYGPVPAGWARDLLAHTTPAGVWIRRLFTHPGTGTLVAMDSARRLFPAALRRYVVARDGTCRTTWCDAPVAQIDHVEPYAEGGATCAANGQGLCVRCNLVKEQPGWRSRVVAADPDHDDQPHTVETSTPTGHRYTSTSPPVLPITGKPTGHVTETTTPPGASPLTASALPEPPTTRLVVLELYRPMTVELQLAS